MTKAEKRRAAADALRFVPTPTQCFMVSLLTECGVPREMIASKITNPKTGKPIATRTLAQAFSKEIQHARALIRAEAAQTVIQIMLSTKVKDAVKLRAAMFYLNTQGGWAHQAAVKSRSLNIDASMDANDRVKVVRQRLKAIIDAFDDDDEDEDPALAD